MPKGHFKTQQIMMMVETLFKNFGNRLTGTSAWKLYVQQYRDRWRDIGNGVVSHG